jgi:PAS domain S-box-containing protein
MEIPPPHSPTFPDFAESFTGRRIRAGFVVALAGLAATGTGAVMAIAKLRENATWVEHTREVVEGISRLNADTAAAESADRGYAITGDERYRAPYDRTVEDAPLALARLQRLTADNDSQQRRLRLLQPLLEAQLAFCREVIVARRDSGLTAAQALLATRRGEILHEQLFGVSEEMKRAEEDLLAQRLSRAARSVLAAQAVALGGGLLAFSFVAVAAFVVRRDFTARQRAIGELARSEENLSVTLRSIGDGVLATDPAGRVTRMNPVAERLTGWSEEDATGRPIAEVFRIVHEQSREPALIPVDAVLASGDVHGLAHDIVLIARDGTERAISDCAAPIRDSGGAVRGVVLVFHDVSAERKAEQTLEATQADLAHERARLQFVFDSVPVGISYALTLPDGRRTRLINDAHLCLCGLGRDEVDDPAAFVRATHPDDRARQAELNRQLESGETNGYTIDKRYRHADGRTVWVMLSFQRRHLPDGSKEDLSVAVDITARKRAVAELETFFAVSLDFLCIAAADGYFKRASPAVTDILGWTVEEFMAQPYLTLVHPDDRDRTVKEVEKQIIRGESVLQFENRYRHKDGTWRVLSWRSIPQPDGLMYATARDVTESKRIAERIDRQKAELEAANQELEAFSYSVSHDLRAPLRHVDGYANLLLRDVGDQLTGKPQRYLHSIVDAAHQMGELIEALLAFSRMSREPLHLQPIDLAAMVDEVRNNLETVTGERNISWRIGTLPPVQGDPKLIRQVLANLFDNAVKYTRGRDPAVIEFEATGRDENGIVFRVRDNGAGFDMRHADQLFGVFQRLHRADEFEGHGIGLANVRRIVSRHGGRTWAEAKPNAGATFYFCLPPAGASPTSRNPA